MKIYYIMYTSGWTINFERGPSFKTHKGAEKFIEERKKEDEYFSGIVLSENLLE